jgi:hypothetical protein
LGCTSNLLKTGFSGGQMFEVKTWEPVEQISQLSGIFNKLYINTLDNTCKQNRIAKHVILQKEIKIIGEFCAIKSMPWRAW